MHGIYYLSGGAQRPSLSLAPLAGISDWPFRLLCFEQGAHFCVTEMISAQGYLTAPATARAYQHLLSTHPSEGPVVAQLFGHKPQYIGDAARKLSDLGVFSGIDLNMGCPAPKVCTSGSGSALMKDLPQAAQIIAAARQGTSLPLSVKMRIGWDADSINAVPFARMAQQEGAQLLTVHGRTRSQQYAGKADWQAIAQVKQAVTIPVIANGDVFTPEDAQRILSVTGCDGIAIGRGALGNPWLFARIARGSPPPSPQQVLDTAMRHARLMADWKGEEYAVVEMRKHFSWYLKGMRGAAQVRARINHMRTLVQVQDALAQFIHPD